MPPAKNLRERLAVVAAASGETSVMPGAVIDAIVLRVCGRATMHRASTRWRRS